MLVLTLAVVPILSLGAPVETIALSEITDFNGDGYADLAIGAPDEDIGTIKDVGVVHVIYGSRSGLSPNAPLPDQLWSQGSPNVEGNMEWGDKFGSALTTGDFDGDGFSDLAIGVPTEAIGWLIDAGGINVIYGSSAGLSATALPDGTGRDDQFWSQNSEDVENMASTNNKFGSALASGDFNGDGYSDLSIGVPFEEFDVVGAINVIYGSSEGLSAIPASDGTGLGDQFYSQDSPDIEGNGEVMDQFGSSLAADDFNGDGFDDLAIGVPNDKNNEAEELRSGAVNVLYGYQFFGLVPNAVAELPDQLWLQDSLDMEGTSEVGDMFGASLTTGDFNNDGYSDLAIGVPKEDIGVVVDAGAVNVLYGSSSGLRDTPASDGTGRTDQLWQQNSINVDGNSEPGDIFGFSLASGDFNGDGRDDLAIGVPLEDIFTDSGRTIIIEGSPTGLSTSIESLHQDKSSIEGSPESFDSYGYSLAASDFNKDGFDDLVIGIPMEDIVDIENAGAVNVIYGSRQGVSEIILNDQFWTQKKVEIADRSEADDMFGYSLGATQ